MESPIYDFVSRYASSATERLHMPGHKGRGPLGIEALDITEIRGADALYEAEGIIAQSQANASALFDSGRTLYSTEGSSQCIKAMLYLALLGRVPGTAPVVLAARNVHRSFVYAAALLDIRVLWLRGGEERGLCSCPVGEEELSKALDALADPPAAVYLTSPDYLGGVQDIEALARVCHDHGTRLLVDGAHGAYLHFLPRPSHPLDLGADICCDSAHKTLPVLTGGAYLHLSKAQPRELIEAAPTAMAMFGSTSPSYLTLCSLDLCNKYLSGDYPRRLQALAEQVEEIRQRLRGQGWQVPPADPLRLTIRSPQGLTGQDLAQRLRQGGMETEYADRDSLVCMLTPENDSAALDRIPSILGPQTRPEKEKPALPELPIQQVCSIRQAVLSPQERVSIDNALGRVCAAPVVACPPAIPIAISGERICRETIEHLRYWGMDTIAVIKDI